MTCAEVARLFCVSETTVRLSRGDFARLRHTTINTGSRKRPLILREDVEALALEKAEGAQAMNPKPSPARQQKACLSGKETQLRGSCYGRPSYIEKLRYQPSSVNKWWGYLFAHHICM